MALTKKIAAGDSIDEEEGFVRCWTRERDDIL
jgi:hypothetical protein